MGGATFHPPPLLTLANHIRIVRSLLGAGQPRVPFVERQFHFGSAGSPAPRGSHTDLRWASPGL
jgi:hypothetical protein